MLTVKLRDWKPGEATHDITLDPPAMLEVESEIFKILQDKNLLGEGFVSVSIDLAVSALEIIGHVETP